MQQLSLFDYFSQTSLKSSLETGQALNLVQPHTSSKGGRSKDYAYDRGAELQGANKHLLAHVNFSGERQQVMTGTCYGGPYPEKDERKSINDAFRRWWKVLSGSVILHNKEF